jgi:hypothetical protein
MPLRKNLVKIGYQVKINPYKKISKNKLYRNILIKIYQKRKIKIRLWIN